MYRRQNAKAVQPNKSHPATVAGRYSVWLGALFLVVATILAYQPAWHGGFIWDDDEYVTGNPLLTAPDGLSRIWFSFDSPSQYFPLTYTVFRLEHFLWGFDAAGYHWVNILLHVVNALLVWRLFARLCVPGAWLAAAIFALHPVQVESVAWITELKNVMMCFFFLLALLAWDRQLEIKNAKYKIEDVKLTLWYWLALVFYALALSAKTTACTLPVAMLLILWLKKQPITRRRIFEVMPFVALGIGMGLLTIWWERFHQGTQGKPFSLGWMDRILLASRAVWFYVGKLVWPANLAFSYPRWTITAANPWAYVWLLALAVLGAVMYRVRHRFGRSLEVGVLFFAITLAPVLGFIMLYTFLYSYVADHYQYVACLGLIPLFSAGLSRVAGHSKQAGPWVMAVVSVGLPLTLAGLTWQQARIYADSETLWRDSLAKNPASWMAQNNLGTAVSANGRLDEAIPLYEESIRLNPDFDQSHFNLGHVLDRQGKTEAAITQYRESIRLEPDDGESHGKLGVALAGQGRKREAIGQLQVAVRLGPDDFESNRELGYLLATEERFDEAIPEYHEAARLHPEDAGLRNDLGILLAIRGRADQAVDQFREALRLNPDFEGARQNLARALASKNKPAAP